MLEFEFTEELLRSRGGEGSWYFIEIEPELATQISTLARGMKGGWGSVRVTVRIGATEWHTSIFPNKETGTYFLPVKKEVRKAEGLDAGDEVEILLRLGD
jgi:hypothetical protein